MSPETLNLNPLKPILEKHTPGGQSELIPALWEAQEAFGYLSEPVVTAIGKAFHVPLAEIHGVIEFYTMLYNEPKGETVVRICVSPTCAQVGGKEILDALCDYYGVGPGGTTADGKYTIEGVECLGLCDHAPAGLVGEVPVAHLEELDPSQIAGDPPPAPLGLMAGEPRLLTKRIGEVDPRDLEGYQVQGGFEGLRKALLEMAPEEVIAEIEDSGLVGRGGAAFPTGLKWKFTAGAEGEPKFIVCNGDESEPGTFKDRILMEGDPYAILEGMILAGYAVGAEHGFIYVRGEYFRARELFEEVVEKARQGGLLGKDILGSGFSFDVEVHPGAGAYICGEETALFESLEGKRGFPRLKPPFPTTNGLFGKPTVINNVETLAAASWIIAHGADAYRSQGTEDSPGTKLFCLSGDVVNPGVYEAPFGIKMGDLLEMAGGVKGELQAALVGGAAGYFASPDQLDVPMSFEGLREAGLALGSGVIIAVNQDRDLRESLMSLAHFFAHESCGKCFPCRLGTQRQLDLLTRIFNGEGSKEDLETLEDVGFTMTETSLCGLGQTAAIAILSAKEKWPELFHRKGS